LVGSSILSPGTIRTPRNSRKLGASCEARSLQGVIGVLSELHSLGIDLASHQQGIDTTTPAGKATFQMMGVFAEFERSMIVERVRESVRRWRLRYSGSPRAHDASVGTIGEHLSSSVDRLTPITTMTCNKRQHRENESIWRFTMAVKMSMNAVIGAIVLALGLTSPMVAQSACIDEPCPAPRNPTQSAAATGSIEWSVKSNYKYKAGIKFYSQTRKGHVWPNAGEMWTLNDYATHTFRMSCMPGEKICFGAWSTGNDKTYWGVGHGDKYGCSNCCHTCGDKTRQQVLNP
jgi:hypothetical protein